MAVSEWVVVFLAPNEQVFSYVMPRTSCISREDNDVRFLQDQHVSRASSLKQHAAPLVHINPNPNQPVCALTPL
jgi:hypothetical protein